MDAASLFNVKVSKLKAYGLPIPPSLYEVAILLTDLIQDKVVLVTGGAKGIGRMISEGFVTNGAKVYISSRDAKACEQTAKELNALGTFPSPSPPLHNHLPPSQAKDPATPSPPTSTNSKTASV